MQANAYSPYALKDLHQAIDLIDRKINYCNTWETFESQEARDAHLRKLSTKRAALVKSALALAALGVRCDPQYLPRSFIHPPQEGTQAAGMEPLAAGVDPVVAQAAVAAGGGVGAAVALEPMETGAAKTTKPSRPRRTGR